jgi:ribose 5-phosphate isomerase A
MAPSMDQNALKKQVGEAALEYVKPGMVVGVGTGSTVNFFIDALATRKHAILYTTSSSEASTKRLEAHGIEVRDLNSVDQLDVYIDGADEINPHKHMIKGGGAALTREKIVSEVATQFVCIVDSSKEVDVLGAFPLPVEVIPMARAMVARKIVALGGNPEYRENCVTDNGNHILDVHGLNIVDPIDLEQTLNQIPGLVTCGLFARRGADVVLVGTENGVKTK